MCYSITIEDNFVASLAQIQAASPTQGILEEVDNKDNHDAERIRNRITEEFFI